MMKIKDFYKGKKVFVTGHTGFKGTWLIKILVEMGAEVTGYSCEAEDVSLYQITVIDSQINSISGDIRDLTRVKEELIKARPEIVIHMAAQAFVRESYDNPVYTYETNVMGTVNIMESIRCCNSVKSFVNVTTDKVYENKEWAWGYRENENLCGWDPYSNSKSCSELITYSYKNSFFNSKSSAAVSTARSGNVIGGGDFSKDRIIPDCVRYAVDKNNIAVRNPNSIRPYQHVLECLYGYLCLAKKQYENKDYEGSYNFGPEEKNTMSTGELVQLFCNTWGDNQDWCNDDQGGPHEANYLRLDSTKSKSTLNWNPKWDIKTAVAKTVEWSKAYFQEKDTKKASEIMNEQIKEYFDID